MKIGFYRDWIYDELKKNIGEKEAADVVGLIFDKIKSAKGFDEALNVDEVIPKIDVLNEKVKIEDIDPADIINDTAKLFDANDVTNSVSKITQYLEENTNVMYNINEYRVYQFSIYDELKKNIGEKEAADAVGLIFDKVISDRGFDEALNIDGVKIKVIKDINWNNAQTDLQTVENMVRKMPQVLKESVNEINILDVYSSNDPRLENYYKISDYKASCTASMDKGEINVFGGRENISPGIMYHEAAHCWDGKIDGYTISQQEFWNKAMIDDWEINKGEIGVTPYATQAKNANGANLEDFAESVRLFLEDESGFQAKFQNRYEVLKALFAVESN